MLGCSHTHAHTCEVQGASRSIIVLGAGYVPGCKQHAGTDIRSVCLLSHRQPAVPLTAAMRTDVAKRDACNNASCVTVGTCCHILSAMAIPGCSATNPLDLMSSHLPHPILVSLWPHMYSRYGKQMSQESIPQDFGERAIAA